MTAVPSLKAVCQTIPQSDFLELMYIARKVLTGTMGYYDCGPEFELNNEFPCLLSPDRIDPFVTMTAVWGCKWTTSYHDCSPKFKLNSELFSKLSWVRIKHWVSMTAVPCLNYLVWLWSWFWIEQLVTIPPVPRSNWSMSFYDCIPFVWIKQWVTMTVSPCSNWTMSYYDHCPMFDWTMSY